MNFNEQMGKREYVVFLYKVYKQCKMVAFERDYALHDF